VHFIIRNILSIATILLLLAVLAFSILSSVIRGEQRNLPDIKPIVNYNPLVHTTVYSENGDEVFKFGQEKRNLVRL
jgi:membrane carboxypeptidase/penicillin-binding protein